MRVVQIAATLPPKLNLITGMRASINKNSCAGFVRLLLLTILSVTGPAMYGTVLAGRQPAEDDTLERIKNHPLVAGCETVFMMTDRDTYIAGENVWFIMQSLIRGSRTIPRSVAGYAEILNVSGTPVSQCRVLLGGNGHGDGLLQLPDSLSSGDYLLRGYTRAMTSFGPEHFFTKVIRVFNPYNLRPDYLRLTPARLPVGPAVDLYPEGAALPGGRASAVVVRTTDRSRRGTAARVIISYGEDDEADTVYTRSNGLVSLEVPSGASRIRAVAMIDSTVVNGELSGFLHVPHTIALRDGPDGKTRIAVIHAPGFTGISDSYLSLAVVNRNGVGYMKRFRPGTGEELFDIPTEELVHGINECLLYDHNGALLSSLLFMHIDPAEEANIITGDGTVRVTVPGNAQYCTVSAAISAGSQKPYSDNFALLSEWVTAGTLADPFLQPFLSGEEEITRELLVTLSDRFLPADLTILKTVVAETRGLVVECAVNGMEERGPAKERVLFINIPGKKCFLQYAISDNEGRVTFIVPPAAGAGDIVIYPRDTASNLVIKTVSPFFGGSVPMRSTVAITGEMADATVTRMSLNSQVNRIYQIRETDTAIVSPDTSAINHFYGRPGQRLVFSDYIALPEMEEFFFELIPGWNLVRTRTGYEFKLFDAITLSEIRTAPMMLIDGTVTTDPSTIAGLSPLNVDYLDVCPGNFHAGEIVLPPIVSVITLKGDFRMQTLPPQALRIRYPFSNPVVKFRPFTGDASGHMPRFGNTLLWAPAVISAGSRELTFSLPQPDYSRPVTITLAVTGLDGITRLYSRTVESGLL
jgi:hypothetical protein